MRSRNRRGNKWTWIGVLIATFLNRLQSRHAVMSFAHVRIFFLVRKCEVFAFWTDTRDTIVFEYIEFRVDMTDSLSNNAHRVMNIVLRNREHGFYVRRMVNEIPMEVRFFPSRVIHELARNPNFHSRRCSMSKQVSDGTNKADGPPVETFYELCGRHAPWKFSNLYWTGMKSAVCKMNA